MEIGNLWLREIAMKLAEEDEKKQNERQEKK